MADIQEVNRVVCEFLKNTLKVEDVKIIKEIKKGDLWEVEAEVFEESAFIKALGLPTRVMDRNFYLVILNENLAVESFRRKERSEVEE